MIRKTITEWLKDIKRKEQKTYLSIIAKYPYLTSRQLYQISIQEQKPFTLGTQNDRFVHIRSYQKKYCLQHPEYYSFVSFNTRCEELAIKPVKMIIKLPKNQDYMYDQLLFTIKRLIAQRIKNTYQSIQLANDIDLLIESLTEVSQSYGKQANLITYESVSKVAEKPTDTNRKRKKARK